MKHEKELNCLAACLLAFLVSFGGVGCMVTGLNLEVSSLWLLALVCAASAAAGAFIYRFRHGGWLFLALIMLGCIQYVREPEWVSVYWGQVRALLHRMTSLWNNAYGWQVVSMGEETLTDIPLMLIGGFVAIVIARTVCRRKRLFLALPVGLLPLCSCLVVTDTVPDTGYLFAVMLGLTVLALSNSVRRSDLRQGLELTALASLVSAVALMLLFGFVPRDSYVNRTEELQEAILTWAQDLPASVKEWGQQAASGDVQTLQAERENLSTLGNRVERDYPVLEVTAPIDGILYLRGQDFDSYNGYSWAATRTRNEDFLPSDSPAAYTASAQGQVTIDALRYRSVLYVPYYTQPTVTLIGGRVSNEENQRVYSYTLKTLPENWRETVNAAPEYDEGIYLTTGVYDSTRDQWRYRTLPLETQARAKEMLSSILTDEVTATQKADTIAVYVRNSATYSLTPGTMASGEEDFALWFLEDSDEGYCVHFATATAVLLRAAGIDARYVTGYVLQAKAGQTVTVPAKQAHAWVEYFEPRLGVWVVLESTPADLTGQETTVPAETGGETAAPTETEEPSRPDTESEAKPETPDDPTAPTEADDVQISWDFSGLLKWLRRLLTLAVLVGAVIGQRQLRLHLRKKRQRSRNPNARALALWREAELMYRLLREEPSETLVNLAEKAKFSQHRLSREEVAAFETAVWGAKRQLQALPWYVKLLHQYIFAAY